MLRMQFLFGFIFLLISANTSAECVILLHGLTRSASSMTKIEDTLNKKGYKVVNVDYPSTRYKVEILSIETIDQALTQCPAQQKINFVTHSLGGILVRYYLEQKNISALKYVVMLGPPNQGSEVVDKLKHVPGFYFINGEAGMQLGTDSTSIPKRLGAVKFHLGVIAGNRSINWFLSYLIPGEDDGKVSINNSKVDGMHDHIVIPATHPFMMNNKQVIEQVIHFLANGHFKHKT